MKIKSMPQDDRPREKMLSKGVAALSDSELLAVLIRTGGKEKSAVELAHELAATPEKLAALCAMKPAQLALTKGIGPAKAVTIAAALELGRRLANSQPRGRDRINCTKDAVYIILPELRYEDREYFLLLLLNSKGDVLRKERISQGSLTDSTVHPREVFHAAVIHRAAAVLLAHNHPSGDPEPSGEDIELTRALVQAGKVMGIPVVDHIIIGDGVYYSFLEQGHI